MPSNPKPKPRICDGRAALRFREDSRARRPVRGPHSADARIDPNQPNASSTMADDANALPTEPASICGCGKRKRN
jgi:hypothetical protein